VYGPTRLIVKEAFRPLPSTRLGKKSAGGAFSLLFFSESFGIFSVVESNSRWGCCSSFKQSPNPQVYVGCLDNADYTLVK